MYFYLGVHTSPQRSAERSRALAYLARCSHLLCREHNGQRLFERRAE